MITYQKNSSGELLKHKSSPDRSDELVYIEYFKAWDLTYLSAVAGGIGTFSDLPLGNLIGCQGFIGPLPSAFLDK